VHRLAVVVNRIEQDDELVAAEARGRVLLTVRDRVAAANVRPQTFTDLD